MLTVIIPTVQKRLTILHKAIASIQADDAVTEIIVINNKVDEPLSFDEFSKVKIYTPEENLFVNKSWNLGVLMASNNNFCLMNDDVLFHENFCSSIVNSSVFKADSTGMIGINASSIKNIKEAEDFDYPVAPSKDWNPSFVHMGERILKINDWGIAIFGKKENYHTIPDRYKILFGDNWLLYKNLQNGNLNYAISGMTCHHVHSASSASKEFSQIIINDIMAADKSEEFKGCNNLT